MEHPDLLNDVVARFAISSDVVAVEPFRGPAGHINASYVVTARRGDRSVRFFLQRLNKHVFPDLDALMASGHVVWVGREPLGDRDGRISLYLADALPRLLPPDRPNPPRDPNPSSDRDRAVAFEPNREGSPSFPFGAPSLLRSTLESRL